MCEKVGSGLADALVSQDRGSDASCMYNGWEGNGGKVVWRAWPSRTDASRYMGWQLSEADRHSHFDASSPGCAGRQAVG